MKPILFSTDMVKALLDGRKTMTRRVIHPDISNWFDVCKVDGAIAWQEQETGDFFPPTCRARYQVGDILWVRETWQHSCRAPGVDICYRADGEAEICDAYYEDNHWCKWKPSIHMPREAARIFLRVTDVRVERIQQITYGDCCAEGVFNNEDLTNASYGREATEKFRKLWNSINAKRKGGIYAWDMNPWVWVCTFERCEKSEVTTSITRD